MPTLILAEAAQLDLLGIFDRYGFPMLLVAALAVMIVKVAKWLAPRCDKVVDAHVKFTTEVGEQTARTTAILEHHSGILDEHGRLLADVHSGKSDTCHFQREAIG